MNLIDRDLVISQLIDKKFVSTDDLSAMMFNMGIDKAIDTLNNSPIVDAKLRLGKKEYQHDYYERVTKVKRQEKRRQKNERDNLN